MCEGCGIELLDQKLHSTFGRELAGEESRLAKREWEQKLHILQALVAPLARDPSGLAYALLRRFGALNAALAADERDLLSIPSMSLRAARHIACIHEALSICLRERVQHKPVIKNMTNLEEYLKIKSGWKQVEEARILLLDQKRRLLDDHYIRRGSVSKIDITISDVARIAVQWNASSVILVHNHPSGDPQPSLEDINFTSKLSHALEIVGVELHDHIIVAKNRLLSLRSLGCL